MNLMEEKKPKKNIDESFIDDLKEMLDKPHKDLIWNEKFKDVVRKYFDI